jgi:hypothetical protein
MGRDPLGDLSEGEVHTISHSTPTVLPREVYEPKQSVSWRWLRLHFRGGVVGMGLGSGRMVLVGS